MSAVEDLEDQEDTPHAGWVPRVIKGGKGPPEGPAEDYLADMEPMTVFVSSGKDQTDGNLFKLIWKGRKFCLLQLTINEDTFERYVQSKVFCKQLPVYEILAIENPQQEGEDNEPEQRDRTD